MVIIQNIREKLILGHDSYQSFYDLKNDVKNFNYADESKDWFKNGKRHRDNDLPAVIDANGSKCWLKNGKLHRKNDLPAVIHADGKKAWYKNDRFIKRSW